LHTAQAPESSADLVAAHLADVELSLSALPVTRVIPWKKLAHWSLGVGLVAALAGGVLLIRNPRAQLLLQGMRTPASVLHDGTRVAKIAKHVRVRVSYPSYLARPPHTVDDPRKLEVPVGSHLELNVTP